MRSRNLISQLDLFKDQYLLSDQDLADCRYKAFGNQLIQIEEIVLCNGLKLNK